MPSDLFTIKPLTAELNQMLTGGRIQKITQPEKDEIRLEIKNLNKKLTLVISANANAPRCHLTADKKDNPMTAPAFCMHLRKYLLSAEIKSVNIANDDRIIAFSIEGRDELYDNKQYYLYFELMNRYSNIILTDADGIISDCLHRVNFDTGVERVLVPTMRYSYPAKSDKAELYEYDKIRTLLSVAEEENAVSVLLKNINGLSKATATELIFRADLTVPFSDNGIDKLISFLKDNENIFVSENFKPCISNNCSDFFAFPYLSIADNSNFTFYPTLNEAAEQYFLRRDKKIRTNNLAKNVITVTKRNHDKLIKKLGYATEKLAECKDKESYKIKGELLTANLYRLKKGDTEVYLENYYENNKPVKISLDECKTPQQNAAAYYNKYAKLKRAEEFSLLQTKQLKTEIEYIESVSEALSRATIEDIADIKNELAECGIIKKQVIKRGDKKPAPSKPKQYRYNNFTIYVGTNNYLNDMVTFNIGHSNDIWLHTKNEHGSHAIIRADLPVTNEVLIIAAEIVSYYSSARNSNNVAVDYTERKNVRRIKNAGLGMVNYINYKTVYVNPAEHNELLV